LCLTLHPYVKHSEKVPSVFGGHVISMNIPPTKEERRDLMPTPSEWEGNYKVYRVTV